MWLRRKSDSLEISGDLPIAVMLVSNRADLDTDLTHQRDTWYLKGGHFVKGHKLVMEDVVRLLVSC